VFRELVEAVRERKAALPVGTGPGVGVVGYLVNGGLSGYFSRRLGLLGQRVTKLTVVTAAGAIRVVTPDDELFTAMLGAGSALSVVADVTLELAPEGVVRGAEQRVIAFKTRDQAVAFAREALRMQRDQVLADDSVSMGLVVAGTKVLVATVVFYDSFQGNMADFVSPLEKLAARIGLPVVAASHFGSWFETAAALWPVIDGMKGSPLAMLQHCLGTEAAPAHGRPSSSRPRSRSGRDREAPRGSSRSADPCRSPWWPVFFWLRLMGSLPPEHASQAESMPERRIACP
jgi:FAD/FMN-containing dehydrogenase